MVRLLFIVFVCALTLVAVAIFYAVKVQSEHVQVGSTQLKQLGMALYQYHENVDHFPEGGSPVNGGWQYPGWQVSLLPYLGHVDLDRKLNRTVAWDSKGNRAVFEMEVKEFLGTTEVARKTDDGLAVSHFAGSKDMIPSRDYRRIGDVLDGT